MLTAAVSPSSEVVEAAYDIPGMDKYLDYVSVMSYDYHGQWDGQTGHVAPMYHHQEEHQDQDQEEQNNMFNVNFTVHYWLAGGLRRSKYEIIDLQQDSFNQILCQVGAGDAAVRPVLHSGKPG